MPVKSWKKSCTCIWKSIRRGVEAGVTESRGSRWKGWLIWRCCRMFWRWNMVSNSATWGKTEKFIDTRSRFCAGMHGRECTHMLFIVDMDMRIHRCTHIGLCGSDRLVLKLKRYRKAHKSLLTGRKRSGREGRRGNQTREHLRRKW